jgi:hypothetical protein
MSEGRKISEEMKIIWKFLPLKNALVPRNLDLLSNFISVGFINYFCHHP